MDEAKVEANSAHHYTPRLTQTEAGPEDFERLFKEYQICHEHVFQLESYIWQTAMLFGVGSAISLVSLASQRPDWVKTLVATILAINISLVWWRFARRWWSIQHLKLERMHEIDQQIRFRQSVLVEERDVEAQKHRRYWQKYGCFLQRIWNQLCYSIPDNTSAVLSFRKSIQENYEYRGIQPAVRILVCTNILLWVSFALYTVITEFLPYLYVQQRNVCALAVFGFIAVADFCIFCRYWGRP